MTTFHSIAYFAQNEAAGHFFNYHRSVQKALWPYLKDVSVYIPLNSNFEAAPAGWLKWFSPFFNKKTRKKFWKDCVRLFKQPTKDSRIFFLEFFGRRDFALYALAAFLYAKKSDSLWILYRDDPEVRRKKDLKVIRFLSKLLKWKFKERFLPLTDSELLADYYAKWFGRKLPVLPVLYAQFKPVAAPKNEKITCTWLGTPRLEKGAEEIAHLVQIPDPAASRIELDISGATYLPVVKNAINLHLRKAFLGDEEYYEALNRSDVVLLPYDPLKYKRRTSGVFVEAILAGKIPFVKEGSWLAYELKKFDLTELIVEWDDPRFFTHLLAKLQDQNILAKLEKMQKSYLAFHGEENFAQSLYSLTSSAGIASLG